MSRKYVPVQFAPRVYAEWAELFEDLTCEQNCEILKAIAKYPNYEPKDCGGIWKFIKSQIDKDYIEFCAHNEQQKEKVKDYWNKKNNQQLTKVEPSDYKNNIGEPQLTKVEPRKTTGEPKTETETETKEKNLKKEKENFFDYPKPKNKTENTETSKTPKQPETPLPPTDEVFLPFITLEDKELQTQWKSIVSEWLDYKKDLKDSYKSPKSLEAFYHKLHSISGGELSIAREIVGNSIANGYRGIFPLNQNNQTANQTNNQSNRTSQRGSSDCIIPDNYNLEEDLRKSGYLRDKL
ncbi:MAG: hypothetical protein LBS34_00240 [Rickettsiales bacterium]|jgi:hypothetical protein|nr:hypothetical protein [Rickettsiales bacterium]